MRLEHNKHRGGRRVRVGRLKHEPMNDYSFMTLHDTAELVQSHIMVIYNQYYSDYRLTGVPMRFLKQLLIASEPDDALLHLVPFLQVTEEKIKFSSDRCFNHSSTVIGQVVNNQSPPNAMASAEISIMSQTI